MRPETGGTTKPGSESARVKFLDEHNEGERRASGSDSRGGKGYDSRLARQAASQPPWHSAIPLHHIHHPPLFLCPYRAFPPPAAGPLPLSPAFTHTSDEKRGCVCVRARNFTKARRCACVRDFFVGKRGVGCIKGRRREGRGIRTRKEGEAVSNGSRKREAERGRSSSTLLRVLRIFFRSDENAHSLAYVSPRVLLSGSDNDERYSSLTQILRSRGLSNVTFLCARQRPKEKKSYCRVR